MNICISVMSLTRRLIYCEMITQLVPVFMHYSEQLAVVVSRKVADSQVSGWRLNVHVLDYCKQPAAVVNQRRAQAISVYYFLYNWKLVVPSVW